MVDGTHVSVCRDSQNFCHPARWSEMKYGWKKIKNKKQQEKHMHAGYYYLSSIPFSLHVLLPILASLKK